MKFYKTSLCVIAVKWWRHPEDLSKFSSLATPELSEGIKMRTFCAASDKSVIDMITCPSHCDAKILNTQLNKMWVLYHSLIAKKVPAQRLSYIYMLDFLVDDISLIFTRGLYGHWVLSLPASVCPSVCQSLACPHDNSRPVQARITKFEP